MSFIKAENVSKDYRVVAPKITKDYQTGEVAIIICAYRRKKIRERRS
jgi:hypothetical protein